MDSLKRELLFRKQSLEKAIEKAKAAIAAAPEGTLRVDASKGKVRYYHVHDNHQKVYIPKKSFDIAERLANKDYAKKMISRAQKELDAINLQLRIADGKNAETAFSDLSGSRKNIVTPFLIDEGTARQKWLSQPYERSSNHPEHMRFKTRKGDMVRSKSEAFIANTYYELGIAYRYECTLFLKDNVTCNPDFTILDTAHHRIVYHEHLGRLDNSAYLEEQLWKFNEYRKNGIYVGKNLIVTYETDAYPFDPEQFRASVHEMFLV